MASPSGACCGLRRQKYLDGADVIDCVTPRCFGPRFFAEAVATEPEACSDRMNGAPA